MIRFAFVWACLLCASSAYTQFKVGGKITDDSGNSLIGANVVLKSTEYKACSGLDGTFELKNIRAGKYTIAITYVGYQDISEELDVSKDLSLNYTMKGAAIMGEEIIVRGSRAGGTVPVAFSNIDREKIEQNNLGQDIPYLLSLTPSFVTTSDAGTGIGYTGFRIRGTDANRINVTVNGIPLNDAESQGVYWVDLPDLSSSLEDLQIQRGVGTSTNGAGAFGATINMQTNTLQKDPYAEINSSAGSFNTEKNTLRVGSGLLNNKFSFDARLSQVNSDGYIDRAWSNLKSFFVSGGYITGKTVIKLNVFSGTEHTYQAWNGVPSYLLDSLRTYNSCGEYTDRKGNVQYYNNETDNYRQDHYQLLISHRINKYIDLNLAFHYTYGRGYYEEYKQDQNLESYLLDSVVLGDTVIKKTDLVRQKWLDNDFYGMTFSACYRHNRSDLTLGGAWNQYDGREFGRVIWAQYMSNGMKDHEWYRGTGVKTDFNEYVKYNFLILDGFNIYTDMQLRHIEHKIGGIDADLRDITQVHSFIFFNPKMGLFYKPGNNHEMYLSFSVGNREPNRSNYTDAGSGDPLPKSERLYDYESGYNFHRGMIKAGVNFYYMDYKDQLILTGRINDVGSAIMTNVGKSYRTGIELTVGLNVRNKLQWNLNTTVSRNKIQNFIEYTDEYDADWNYTGQNISDLGQTDIAFSPNITAGSNLQFSPVRNLSFAFISQFTGKQYIDNTSSNDRKLNPYFVSNVGIQYSLTLKSIKKIEFSLQIHNLFNEQYESNGWVYSYYFNNVRTKEDGLFPQAGINFLTGIALKF